MSKATKKRIRRIEHSSRFMTPEDGLTQIERKYLNDLDTATDAFLLVICEDFAGTWSDEDIAYFERVRASLPPGATSDPPSDAHLSPRSKRKIAAVLENRGRGFEEEIAKLEREGKLPMHEVHLKRANAVRKPANAT